MLDTWPPAYTLKKSAKTKHVRLKASARYGLELYVPKRFNEKNIPEILETNKIWIEVNLRSILDQRLAAEAQDLPTHIKLPALNQSWQVFYIASEDPKVKLHLRPQNELILLGNITDKSLCKKRLTDWVKKQGRLYLLNRLKQLSNLTELPYKDATIRGQRSRWGSCSADKSINLNYKLLFLETGLVDHIMIHELCHTVHMNHSTQFWRLVAKHDIQWKHHSRAVRLAEQQVPYWIDAY